MPERGILRKYASGAALRDFQKPGEGLAAALARLEGLEGVTIAVGVLDDIQTEDGVSLASIAFWNEYGTRTAPARPWMRYTVMKHRKKWMRRAGAVVRARGSGGRDGVAEMESMAEQVIEDLQDSLLHGPWERNAEATIKKKGFDMPLWETGLLHDSMSAEITGVGMAPVKVGGDQGA